MMRKHQEMNLRGMQFSAKLAFIDARGFFYRDILSDMFGLWTDGTAVFYMSEKLTEFF